MSELGRKHLAAEAIQTELRKIGKEIADLKRKLALLEARKTELERAGDRRPRKVNQRA
jgi:hypothetical protein